MGKEGGFALRGAVAAARLYGGGPAMSRRCLRHTLSCKSALLALIPNYGQKFLPTA